MDPTTVPPSSPNESSITSTAQWILIPLVVVIAIGCFVLARHIISVQRRRYMACQEAENNPNSSTYDPERAETYASLRLPPTPVQLRRLRARSRWGWANRSSTGGQDPRCEEGLNELGQAPPPYDGRKLGGVSESANASSLSLQESTSVSRTGDTATSVGPGYITAPTTPPAYRALPLERIEPVRPATARLASAHVEEP